MTELAPLAPLTDEDRKAISYRVARQIYAAECAIETAYKEAALLAVELTVARVQGRIPTTTDQEIFTHATSIMGALTDARGRAIDLHRRAEAIGRRLRMDFLPPDTPKPDQGVIEPSLRAIEAGRRAAG
jgi:hypothetical protein